MRRIFRALLFWTLILSACSIGVSSPQTIPASTTEAPVSIPPTAVPPNPHDCGYQWATQALPELSSSFQGSIQALQPEAQASAYAFGENCMLADGSNGGFGAMETDFKVTLNVSDLTNEADLGEWIVKVMQVITAIPKDQIAGPQPGRVTITFQSDGDQKIINFYINQYKALSPSLSSSEIYQALKTPQ